MKYLERIYLFIPLAIGYVAGLAVRLARKTGAALAVGFERGLGD